MPDKTGITWTGDDIIIKNMGLYGHQVKETLYQIALYWAPIVELYAKENAPWTDRTGNARQTLHSWVDRSDEQIKLHLSHGRIYGIWLELANQGRYAIIMESLEVHYPLIMGMVRGVFK